MNVHSAFMTLGRLRKSSKCFSVPWSAFGVGFCMFLVGAMDDEPWNSLECLKMTIFFLSKKTVDHFWPGTLLAWLELGFESFRKGDLSTSLRLQTMQNPYEDAHLLEKMRNWTLLNCRDGKECGKPSSLIRSWKREWIDWVSSLFVYSFHILSFNLPTAWTKSRFIFHHFLHPYF